MTHDLSSTASPLVTDKHTPECEKFHFQAVSEGEIQRIVTSFQTNKAPGYDKIPMSVIKSHDCEYRDLQERLKNLKILIFFFQKNPFGKLSSKKIIFNFQESIVFEKIRKNENSSFYLINYAKIRVKMTYFIASPPRQD